MIDSKGGRYRTAVKFSGELVCNSIDCCLPMPYDREIWDLTSVLYAIEPKKKFFSISKVRNVKVDNQGEAYFEESSKAERFIVKANKKAINVNLFLSHRLTILSSGRWLITGNEGVYYIDDNNGLSRWKKATYSGDRKSVDAVLVEGAFLEHPR